MSTAHSHSCRHYYPPCMHCKQRQRCMLVCTHTSVAVTELAPHVPACLPGVMQARVGSVAEAAHCSA